MNSSYKINAAIQVLPEGKKDFSYPVIDHCISLITCSGLKYRVCPFETVVEGYWDEIIPLLEEIRNVCYADGAANFLMNVKFQMSNNEDVLIETKIAKYEK
ncbi:MAG: thiamine-binding protein [Bacteroidales bacterium]|nr:thiamine-binding protein [Bacteroidales bacterium]MCB9012859.1 thiamine-binding protein [Bacteroidales bacterium]